MKQLLAVTALAMVAPMSFASLINFDDITAGTIVDDEYLVGYGVSFSGFNVDRGVGNLAVAFDTTDQTSEDPDLEAPFSNFFEPGLGVANPGNVLIINEIPGNCNGVTCTNPDDEGSRPAGYFSIMFDSGVTLNSIDFFDIEREEAVANNAIRLFDIVGDEMNIGQFFTPATGGNNTWGRMDFNVAGVYEMEIRLNGSGAIDNLNFTKVPEPATLALFGIGLAGMGFARKKRKSA